jgi:hypothetical protein
MKLKSVKRTKKGKLDKRVYSEVKKEKVVNKTAKEMREEWKKQMAWLQMTQSDLGSAARIVVSDFNNFIYQPKNCRIIWR